MSLTLLLSPCFQGREEHGRTVSCSGAHSPAVSHDSHMTQHLPPHTQLCQHSCMAAVVRRMHDSCLALQSNPSIAQLSRETDRCLLQVSPDAQAGSTGPCSTLFSFHSSAILSGVPPAHILHCPPSIAQLVTSHCVSVCVRVCVCVCVLHRCMPACALHSARCSAAAAPSSHL